MKKYLALAAAVACFAAPQVFAQTCTAPAAFDSPASAPTASGDTCAASDEVSAYCVLQDSAGKPDVIYQITLPATDAPSRTATSISITGAGTGYTPTIYLYSDACASANSCVASGQAGSPMDITSVGAGTYFLAATASQVDASGACGTYTITANGTLPVELKNFTVN